MNNCFWIGMIMICLLIAILSIKVYLEVRRIKNIDNKH